MSSYSFLNIVASISGPGGSINLGSGAGTAEEGITVEPVNDKSTMMSGADGSGVHSLRADNSRTVKITLLKTSPVNAQLMNMFNFQTQSSATHGRNMIAIRDVARGDSITLEKVAFKRCPNIEFKVEAGTNEWLFDAIDSSTVLGVGTPEA